VVKIACPQDCPHLAPNEDFQRARQKARHREAWVKAHEDLRGHTERLELGLALEQALKVAVDRLPGATDADVVGAIGDVLSQMSPIEIVMRAPTPLGRLFWDALQGLSQAAGASRDDMKDELLRLQKVASLVQDPDVPRAFVLGLSAHAEGVPAARGEPERTGLIVTPSDLRRARG